MLFIFIGVLGGATPNLIMRKIKLDLWVGLLGSWSIWPLGHYLNFRFIPANYRLLYVNIVQIIYNVYLSSVISWPHAMF